MPLRIVRAVVVGILVGTTTAALAGCVSPLPDGDGVVVVFAASSLSDVFDQVETAFEAENPDLDVRLNFAGSASLREQILEGAPADIFASANESNMTQLAENGRLPAGSDTFARNHLIIAVPEGNPALVETLADFSNDSLLLGLCEVSVPCGDFARQALTKAAIVPRIDTNEPDARALLTKIGEGELDAGIVYRTDVLSDSPRVDGVPIPEHFNVAADYRIATVGEAPHPQAASRFIDFVLSEDGQRIVADHGFVPAADADVTGR